MYLTGICMAIHDHRLYSPLMGGRCSGCGRECSLFPSWAHAGIQGGLHPSSWTSQPSCHSFHM